MSLIGYTTGSLARTLDAWDNWEFGRHGRHPYQLKLAEHGGLILGQTEEGLLMSLVKLASLARSHGWKVVCIDPQSTAYRAASFITTLHIAGCEEVYTLGELPLDTLRRRLSRVLTSSSGSSAYLAVNAWSNPAEARTLAQHLLAHIVRLAPARMLLLLPHAALLFELEQILPLFALFEQWQGSLFVAARSLVDFGGLGAALTRNARTLIVHRSHPSPHLSSCIGSFWARHQFQRAIRALPDQECFVLSKGVATRVRIEPISLPDFTPVHLPWIQEDLVVPRRRTRSRRKPLIAPASGSES